MSEEGFKRKLVAILSADAVGYSRLMRDDEESTVRELTAHRLLINEIIHQHGGKVIDSPGDNLLAEFTSVVNAVNGALKIQERIKRRNADIPDGRRLEFRIGINLGDVIDEGGRIYGDGVNIAARVEGLAAAGGISISGTVYEHIRNKLPLGYHDLGERNVKNISEPIRVYRISMEPEAAGKVLAENELWLRSRSRAALTFAALAVAVAAAAFWMYFRPAFFHEEKAAVEKDPLKLSDRASIAVLPFKNLSGDSEQEYFSDGITNDIITDLSRFRNLLVIASNTVFTYKGKTVNVKTVGRELEVRYVLEGSVQKVGGDLRINAQLIESSNETHLWAERYQGDYKDIFKLQGDIVQAIVGKLAVNISQTEQARAMRKKPQDLQAYDYLLQGWAHYQRQTRASVTLAGELFVKAAALDPLYSAAYVGLGWVDYAQVSFGWTEFPHKALESAYEYGRKALELDKSNSSAHTLLCNVYTFQNKYDLAIHEAEQAIELNPNDAYAFGQYGWALLWAGQVDEAAAALEMSLRLDSASPREAWFHLGMAYYLKGKYGESLEVLEKGLIKRPDFVGNHIVLAATYSRLGRNEEAEHAAETVRRLDPFFKIESFGTAFRNQSHREAFVEGLRTAGLK